MLQDGRPPSHNIPRFPANKWLKAQPTAPPSVAQHGNSTREASTSIIDPSLGATHRAARPMTGHRRPLPRNRPSSAPSTPTSASLITFPLFNATIRSLVPDLSEADALRLFERFDPKRTGRIDQSVFSEALAACSKRMSDSIRVSHVKTSLDIGGPDSHERRCIRAAQAAQAERSRHVCLGSTARLRRVLQDKVAQKQAMGQCNARYPVLRGFKSVQGQGSRVSREEFHRAVQLRVPGASLQESNALFDEADVDKMDSVEIEAIIKRCLMSEDEQGAVRRGSDAGFLLAGRVDRARVKINDAMHKTIQRSQSMGAAMSATEMENQLRRRIEGKTGDTNRLKAFRLLTHPLNQRSSSEAPDGPGSGGPQSGGPQGRGGQSTVKLGDLASALQANNFYADKESTSRMFRSLDADKDGQIDVHEFMHWLRRPYARSPSSGNMNNMGGKNKAAMAAQLRALQNRKRRMMGQGQGQGGLDHQGPTAQGQGPTTARSATSDRSGGPNTGTHTPRHRDLDDVAAMEGPDEDALMESLVHRMRHTEPGSGGAGLNRQFDPQAFQGLLKVKNLDLYGPGGEGMLTAEQVVHRQQRGQHGDVRLSERAKECLPSDVLRLAPRLKAALYRNIEKFIQGLIEADRLDNGYVRFKDLLRLVRQVGLRVGEAHFVLLLRALGLRTHRQGVVRYHRLFEALNVTLPGVHGNPTHWRGEGAAAAPGTGREGEGLEKPEDGEEDAAGEGKGQGQGEGEDVGEWEAALEVVNDRVTTHWRALHQRFKACDREQSGSVSVSDFLDILQQEAGLDHSFAPLLTSLVGASSSSGRRLVRVAYADFLQPFVSVLYSHSFAASLAAQRARQEQQEDDAAIEEEEDKGAATVRPKSATARLTSAVQWASGREEGTILLARPSTSGGARRARPQEGGEGGDGPQGGGDAARLQRLCASLRPRLLEAWKALRQYWRSVEAGPGAHRKPRGEVGARVFHSGLLRHSVPLSDAACRVLVAHFATVETRKYVDMPAKELLGSEQKCKPCDLVLVRYDDFIKHALSG